MKNQENFRKFSGSPKATPFISNLKEWSLLAFADKHGIGKWTILLIIFILLIILGVFIYVYFSSPGSMTLPEIFGTPPPPALPN